jgi:hypothetical protein
LRRHRSTTERALGKVERRGLTCRAADGGACNDRHRRG